MKDKRVVFMGSPDFAVPILEMLIEKTNVVLVVSQEDKARGRGMDYTVTPIKNVAIKNEIEVFTPHNIREDYQLILDKKPDIIITCAYGQIIPKALLDYPKFGCINVHASILPKLRGGAPLHKAIIYGEIETGVSIMYMDEKMDTGDIISVDKVKIKDEDNVGTIHDKLSIMGRDLLLKTLPSIFNGTNERIKQDDRLATYAYNISKEEEKLDFKKSAREVFNQIRGLYPFPVAYILLDNEIIKICESKISEDSKGVPGEITCVNKNGITVKCLDKSIIITRLKPSGKKEMDTCSFLNGYKKELIGKRI